MENYRYRKGKKLAEASTEFQRVGVSRGADGQPDIGVTIEICFADDQTSFSPGDVLTCEYSVRLNDDILPSAIETSVLWLTEGKGEEDIGVHFFERRNKLAITNETFNHSQRVSTVLPSSPFSYEGKILKIHWCVRVRMFMVDGQIWTEDKYFKLGTVKQVDPESSQ